MAEQPEIDIAVDYTVNIVANYVRANHVPAGEVPGLIVSVHAALARIAGGTDDMLPADYVEPPTPAEIRKSIRPDALTSFIDGKKYKTLKRHLGKHGLTPDGYRARFGLPLDYPMCSPAYSAQRSALAKEMRLGVIAGRGEAESPTLN